MGSTILFVLYFAILTRCLYITEESAKFTHPVGARVRIWTQVCLVPKPGYQPPRYYCHSLNSVLPPPIATCLLHSAPPCTINRLWNGVCVSSGTCCCFLCEYSLTMVLWGFWAKGWGTICPSIKETVEAGELPEQKTIFDCLEYLFILYCSHVHLTGWLPFAIQESSSSGKKCNSNTHMHTHHTWYTCRMSEWTNKRVKKMNMQIILILL